MVMRGLPGMVSPKLLRAAAISIAFIVVTILIARADLPYATALVLLLLFGLAAYFVSDTRGRLQNVCLSLATLLFGLAAVDGVLEYRAPRTTETQMKTMWAMHPLLGYHASTPGLVPAEKHVDGKLAYKVSYTIGPDLNRLTESTPDGPKVRFFGDSYTFGEGLDDEETLPQIFADLAEANVINFGYPGYSPAHALRALQSGMYDKELEGARLFVLQTGPFHVERTACLPWWTKSAPQYQTRDGKLVLTGKCAPLTRAPGALETLVQPFTRQISRSDVDNYLNVVDAFIKLSKEKYHVDVLILDMRFDSDFGHTRYSWQEAEANFRNAGASVIDDTLPLKADERTIPFDGHPNRLANYMLAQKMVTFLQSKNIVGLNQ